MSAVERAALGLAVGGVIVLVWRYRRLERRVAALLDDLEVATAIRDATEELDVATAVELVARRREHGRVRPL